MPITKINVFPTTQARLKRTATKPVRAPDPFQPTVRPVAEVVPGGNYTLVVSNEGFVPTGTNPYFSSSTESVAAALSLALSTKATSTTDSFGSNTTPASFMLSLVVTDKSNGMPAMTNATDPLMYKVSFAMNVTDGSTATTLVNLTSVGPSSVVLNGNTYSAGINKLTGQFFAAPGPISASRNGAVTLDINVVPGQGGGGGGGGPHDTPEPSSMALAGLGVGFMGLVGLRRRNRSVMFA